jgi:hypothetical protein
VVVIIIFMFGFCSSSFRSYRMSCFSELMWSWLRSNKWFSCQFCVLCVLSFHCSSGCNKLCFYLKSKYGSRVLEKNSCYMGQRCYLYWCDNAIRQCWPYIQSKGRANSKTSPTTNKSCLLRPLLPPVIHSCLVFSPHLSSDFPVFSVFSIFSSDLCCGRTHPIQMESSMIGSSDLLP